MPQRRVTMGTLHLRVGKLPDRSSPAIYIEDGAQISVLGYFKDENHMRSFLGFNPQYKPIKDKGTGKRRKLKEKVVEPNGIETATS